MFCVRSFQCSCFRFLCIISDQTLDPQFLEEAEEEMGPVGVGKLPVVLHQPHSKPSLLADYQQTSSRLVVDTS